jgi:hypothetical protein
MTRKSLTLVWVGPRTTRPPAASSRSARAAWAASPEKGERLLAAISRDVADALADQRLWEAPI